MSDSSDQEIFRRRRTYKHEKKKNELENLFSEESEESVSIEEEVDYYYQQEKDSILIQVFGFGTEYDYVYEDDEIKNVALESSESQEEFECDEYFDYFITREIDLTTEDKHVLRLLKSGFSIFYIFFHGKCSFDIFSLFEIRKRIFLYENLKKEMEKKGIELSFIKFIRDIDDFEVFNARFTKQEAVKNEFLSLDQEFLNEKLVDLIKKKESIVDFFLERRYFLRGEQMYENYKRNLLLNDSLKVDKVILIKYNLSNKEVISILVSYYVNDHFFMNLLVAMFVKGVKFDYKCVADLDISELDKFYGIIFNDFKNHKEDQLSTVISFGDLFFDCKNLLEFVIGTKDFETYHYQFEVIMKVIRSILKGCGFLVKLKEEIKILKNKESKKRLIDVVMSFILNGSIKSNLTEDTKAMVVFINNNNLYGGIISFEGVNEIVYKIHLNQLFKQFFDEDSRTINKVIEENGIMNFDLCEIIKLSKEMNVTRIIYVVNNRRDIFIFKRFSGKFTIDQVMVENKFINAMTSPKEINAYFKTFCMRVFNPEFLIMELYNRNKINSLFSNFKGSLTDKEMSESIFFTIQLSLCLLGIEYKDLKPSFAPFLNTNKLTMEQISNHNIKKVSDLNDFLMNIQEKHDSYITKEVIGSFDNISVFIRLFGDEFLDRTMIHPKNYGIVYKISNLIDERVNETGGNLDKFIDDEEFIEKCLNFEMETCSNTSPFNLGTMRNMLLDRNRYNFIGTPDEEIFNEIFGDNIEMGRVYVGRITKILKGKYIATVENKNFESIEVHIYTGEKEYFLNEEVNVEILSKEISLFHFTGAIIEKMDQDKVQQPLYFMSHPLFKNFHYSEAISFLSRTNENMVLRKASQENHPVITIKIERLKNSRMFIFWNLYIKEMSIDEYIIEKKPNNLVFNNIDQIISVYIRKMLRLINSIIIHERYRPTKKEAHEFIMNNTKKDRIIYSFFLSDEYQFILGFCHNKQNEIVTEYVKVGEQLFYDGILFNSLSEFINHKKTQNLK